jgi:hypothetical protein
MVLYTKYCHYKEKVKINVFVENEVKNPGQYFLLVGMVFDRLQIANCCDIIIFISGCHTDCLFFKLKV